MADNESSLSYREQRNREYAQSRMKRYADPRTGTISYSGADFSAIVFLPMSEQQLTQKVAFLHGEMAELEGRIKLSSNIWESYDVGIRDELADADYALDQYYHYLEEGNDAQAAFWLAEYTASKTRERELLTRRAAVGGGPAYLSNLQLELQAVREEISELEKLRSKAKRFVRPVKLFDIQTISIQSHREKFPVRTLGRVNAKSYTRGPRTLAGSMIFTLFNKHALWDLVEAGSAFYSSGVGIRGTDSGYPELDTVLVDQLPPFDITLLASNELGDTSYAAIYGVEIVNDGRTISIQDIITESVMQFVCRDYEDLRPLMSRRRSLALGLTGGKEKTATDVFEERRTEFERRRIRLNPFV
jgi:hypothetical protein